MRAERLPAEALAAALLAAFSAALVVALGPPAIDAPAHLYRTELVREGVHLWDNLWYAGQYPLASYSFLYYLPAAVVGNVPLVVAAVVASAALFASLLLHEWGTVGRWPARAYGLLAGGPLLTGTYSYALGLACLLGTLRALQVGRPRVAVVLAALTLGFSPLAFVFLCLALAAIACSRRRLGPRSVALALVAICGLELLALTLFPADATYPFHIWPLLGVLTTSALGVAIALRARNGGALLAFFLLWGVVCLAAFFLPTPLGSNLTRLRFFVFPLGLLTVLLTGFRPRLLTSAGLALGLVYTLVPYLSVLPNRSAGVASEEAFWRPAVEFVQRRSSADYRVEVVPTYDHWEAYRLPRAGIALARGWYRQLDVGRNGILYEPILDGNRYRDWLRRNGVRFVLLPETRLDALGAAGEDRLLQSGQSGLIRVARSASWTIWELPHATPILTGPATARLTAFEHERIAGRVHAAGDYLLRVRWTPYWRVSGAAGCVAETPGGLTLLRASRAGAFALRSDLRGSRC
ncbi:MAG: hypothetical protein H0W14_04730 [Actinobacteria bacterium]|nr:hypothetical protein [Actinomycetota bacterium]